MTTKLLSVTLFTLAVAVHSGEGRAQQQQQTTQPGQSGAQQRTQPGTSTQQGTTTQSPTNQRNQTQSQSSQASSGMTARSFVEKVAEANQMEIEMSRMAASRAQSSQVKSYAQQLVRDHTKSLEDLKKYASKHNITLPSGNTNSASATSTNNRSNTNTNTNSTSAASANNRSNTDTNTNTNTNNTSPRTENRSSSTTQSANTQTGAGTRPDALASADDAHMRDLSTKSGAEFDQAYIKTMVSNHEKAVQMFEQQRDMKDNDNELRGFVNNTLPTLRNHLTKARDLERTVMNTRSTTTPNSARPAGGGDQNSTRPGGAGGDNQGGTRSPNTSPNTNTPQQR
jgi:putative membrane protein